MYDGTKQIFPTGEEKPIYRGNKITVLEETPEEETPEEETPEVYEGPMGDYKVVGEIFPLNEDGSKGEFPLDMGSIHNLPRIIGDQMVSEGTMEEVVPKKKSFINRFLNK